VVSVIKILLRLSIILSVVGTIVYGILFFINYSIGDEEPTVDVNGNVVEYIKKEEINALICGENDNLTDTMIYLKYNVKTGKMAYISIPRDTYVTNPYCIGNKLNAIYRGENIGPLIQEIEELLDVYIDYYLVIDNKVVRELIDTIGGVQVDVPIRMKYDDYTQNLHIDLKPGLQVLDGKKAEMFIRFRKNNDGTGYEMGDLERIGVQQKFIKTLISSIVSPTNITKIPGLVNVALKNTDTNVTIREALRYVPDLNNLKLDSIYSCMAEGSAKYIDDLSYFVIDTASTQNIIKEKFNLTEKVETLDTEKKE
jgi:polyisoprenyl-teichoic acid--peptidoglycan teichoic acid transferase